MTTMRRFVTAEVAVFGLAALVHAGVLVRGYEHRQAAIAETVIAAVLALGLAVSLVAPGWSRAAGVGAQAFALFGTLVGLTMIAIVGPQTTLDLTLHAAMITLLAAGLWSAARAPWRASLAA